MKETHEIPPYDQHAQVLLADLETIECGPVQMEQSEAARQEGEQFITSFVRFDGEPEDPARFVRIARRISDALVTTAATFAEERSGCDQDYRRLKKEIADILLDELGPQKIRYYE